MEKIVILGGGESGVGAAILAQKKGCEVFLSDSGSLKPKYKEMLEEHHIPYEEGHHTEEKILDATEVIKSPGIPPYAPLVKKIAAKGIPVLSEIEYAARFTDARMVCITGSNGKTTTTLLIYHILRKAGLNVGLAGNVGQSLALQVADEEHPHDIYVIELSSFQLENMYRFKANVAVLLNITPDHLDRYDHKFENYVEAKFRIIRNQTPDDYFVYWDGDPVIARQLEHVKIEARALPFGVDREDQAAAWIEGKMVEVQTPQERWEMSRDDLSLKGLHNLYNSMAAGISASVLSVAPDVVKEALSDFEAVEHRLELVDTIEGVRWINDSKATNVNSAYYALESMTTPTVLILGGTDKGNDYSEIEPLVREKVKAIVAMGVDNKKIVDFFTGIVPVVSTDSLDDCIAACRKFATAGDTVLLSPCCASFDLFKSYVDRGNRFKEAVKALRK